MAGGAKVPAGTSVPITLLVTVAACLLMVAVTNVTGTIVHGENKCEDEGSGEEHGYAEFTNQLVSFFKFANDANGYYNNMKCELEFRAASGCKAAVELMQCPLATGGNSCDDEITIYDAEYPFPISNKQLCSGLGDSTPDHFYTYTQGTVLKMTFTTDGNNRGAGCSGVIVQDFCTTRKRRDAGVPDSTEKFLLTMLKKFPLSKAKTYKERKNLLKIRSGLTKKLVLLRQELQAEMDAEEHDIAKRQAGTPSGGSSDPCNCTSTAASECRVLMDRLGVMLHDPDYNRQSRTEKMCEHHQNHEFCFHRYMSRSQLGCNLCPNIEDLMEMHADDPVVLKQLKDDYRRFCQVMY
eukprot:scpid69127/ scgid21292/ 